MPSHENVERLRVLRIIARMNVGGPALQVSGLVQELDERRFEQRLLTGRVASGEADYVDLRVPDLPRTFVDGLGRSVRPLDDLAALRRLVHEMRSFKPHIVHTHTAKAGVLGRVAARIAGVPAIVHTFHGHLLHGYFPPAVTRSVVSVERLLARRTTRLVAVGAQVRDDLIAAGVGKSEQYVVAPPGIRMTPAPSRQEARRSLGLPQEGLVIAFVARLTAVKRPERFVEMARRLHPSHPDAVFIVVGDGELMPKLRAASGPEIRFLGWRGDVETIYAASDLAVLTSDNEGMPVSLIEAAMCGVPAISTRVGSVAEVVMDGRSGWLCPVDVSALTEATDRVMQDVNLLRVAGAEARRYATASFGRSRLVADMHQLYEDIALEKEFPCA